MGQGVGVALAGLRPMGSAGAVPEPAPERHGLGAVGGRPLAAIPGHHAEAAAGLEVEGVGVMLHRREARAGV